MNRRNRRKNVGIRKETHRRMCFFFVFLGICSILTVEKAGASVFVSTKTEEKLITAKDAPKTEAEVEVIAPADGSLHAYSAVLYDGEAGRVLFEKNGYEVLPMASTTKIMTLLIVLENTNPEDIVTVSQTAAKQPDVQLNIKTGEQYYVKDLCYSLMLESHNDTAVALAEHVGGSVEGFAEMMNAKAKALGAYSAHFVTPNGLDADGHGITAADLAKIAAYAVKQAKFREITNTASHSFTELTTGRGFTVNNKDAFLSMMEGAIGVKTGFTGKAGYCFVGALEREDRLLISVVLASGWPPHKTYKWSDTKRLMEYGLDSFQKMLLIEEHTKLPELPHLPVINGQKENVSLRYEKNSLKDLYETKLLRTGKEEIEVSVLFSANELTAPVATELEVGELIVKIDGECIKKIPIQTAETVVPVDYSFYFKKLRQLFLDGSVLNRLRQLHP